MKVEAELLVKTDYAKEYMRHDSTSYFSVRIPNKYKQTWVHVDPYLNTVESKKQAGVLKDWLKTNETHKWDNSIGAVVQFSETSDTQWVLNRIKWCCEQLAHKA